MDGNTFRSEMEKLLNEAQLVDAVLLGRLKTIVNKLQTERDMFREENKRLNSENNRLNRENGKKLCCLQMRFEAYWEFEKIFLNISSLSSNYIYYIQKYTKLEKKLSRISVCWNDFPFRYFCSRTFAKKCRW